MAGRKSKFTAKGPGLDGIKAVFKAMGGAGVKVGILESAGRHGSGGQTIAEIATYNEFGTDDGHIPARPAFRLGVENNRPAIADAYEELTKRVLDGADVRRELGKVGLVAQALIRKSITDLDSPPNAPSTIAQKGSSNPLIDTGLMRRSVNYMVMMPGEKEKA